MIEQSVGPRVSGAAARRWRPQPPAPSHSRLAGAAGLLIVTASMAFGGWGLVRLGVWAWGLPFERLARMSETFGFGLLLLAGSAVVWVGLSEMEKRDRARPSAGPGRG